MAKQTYFGLWERNLNGGTSWSGKATINGVEYWVNLYNNKNENPQSPAFDVCFKPVAEAAQAATEYLQERTPF